MVSKARTSEQKAFRREEILEAAHELLSETGYEVFAMAPLARRAGLAKGTLYLYFATREEVLLALCTRYVDQWVERILLVLAEPVSDTAYAEAFFDAAVGVDNLTTLLTRLDQTIEHNVAVEPLIAGKRAFAQQITTLTGPTAEALGLSLDGAHRLLQALGVLLVGSVMTDQGPSLSAEALPEDVRHLMQQLSARPLFVSNACYIIAGTRTETRPLKGVNA